MDSTKFGFVLCLFFGISGSNGRECFGSNNGLSYSSDSSYRLKNLKEAFGNCTVIRGNLEISAIESDDLSFLKTIEEVKGYVVIFLNTFRYLPLENLKVIRGTKLFQNKYALYIALNYETDGIMGLRELRLTSLTEIQRGGVHISRNRDLCFTETINWFDILNPATQSQWRVEIELGDDPPTCGACNSSCTAGCWGTEGDMCQKITRNCPVACGNARCRGPGITDCCHPECAAGCTGPTNRDCIACLHVNNDGACELQCPPRIIYDPFLSQVVPNHEFKLQYDYECVEQCPSSILTEENFCVKTCSPGRTPDQNGVCIPCTNNVCETECYGVGNPSGPLADATTVHSGNIHNLENCTTVKGNLIFQSYAFKGDAHNGIEPLTADVLLRSIKNIKVITGYLKITSWSTELTDFSALASLEEIQGYDLFRDVVALLVQDNISNGPFFLDHITNLGLNSLKTIARGNVYIGYMKNLCGVNDYNWGDILKQSIAYKSFGKGILLRHLPPNEECAKRKISPKFFRKEKRT